MPSVPLPGIPRPASRLALGTMLYGSGISTEDAFALLDDFVAGGGNVLDTANGYAGWLPGGTGRSEITLGAWLRKSGARNDVIVATKGGQPRDPDRRQVRATPENLSADLQESLERLQLPAVDLYWFHRDNPELPVAELMEWAWSRMDAGQIHAIGASNWTHARITEANALARTKGRPGLAGSQIGWSLLETKADGIADKSLVHMSPPEYREYQASGIPVFAYQAQARGYFSPAKRQSENHRKRYDTPRNRDRLHAVDAIAARTGWTQNQIALAWFWRRPFPAIPVIGARTREQLSDSLAALDITLTAADEERLTLPPPHPTGA